MNIHLVKRNIEEEEKLCIFVHEYHTSRGNGEEIEYNGFQLFIHEGIG